MLSRKTVVVWLLIVVVSSAGILLSKWSLLESVNADDNSHYTRIKNIH